MWVQQILASFTAVKALAALADVYEFSPAPPCFPLPFYKWNIHKYDIGHRTQKNEDATLESLSGKCLIDLGRRKQSRTYIYTSFSNNFTHRMSPYEIFNNLNSIKGNWYFIAQDWKRTVNGAFRQRNFWLGSKLKYFNFDRKSTQQCLHVLTRPPYSM